jgi:hypothetical protein
MGFTMFIYKVSKDLIFTPIFFNIPRLKKNIRFSNLILDPRVNHHRYINILGYYVCILNIL